MRELNPGLQSWPRHCGCSSWGTTGVNDPHWALHQAGGRAAPLSANTWKSAQQAPPPEDELDGQGKNKLLTKQHWKVPGEVKGLTVYRIRGYSPLFFVFCLFFDFCLLPPFFSFFSSLFPSSFFSFISFIPPLICFYFLLYHSFFLFSLFLLFPI